MQRTFLSTIFIVAMTASFAQVCEVTITHEVNGSQVQYFATSPDAPAQWSWFFNGGTPLTSNVQNPVVTYSEPGQYITAISIIGGPNGCSAALSSDLDTVIIGVTGVAEVFADGFRIQVLSAERLEVENASHGVVRMEVIDLGGKSVGTLFNGVLPSGRSTLPINSLGLAKGMYLLHVNGPWGSLSRRFVVE